MKRILNRKGWKIDQGVHINPSAIGPFQLTPIDVMWIWAPIEISKDPVHKGVIEVEWLWRIRKPHRGVIGGSQFVQFGPFDLRRSPYFRQPR